LSRDARNVLSGGQVGKERVEDSILHSGVSTNKHKYLLKLHF